MNPLAWWQALPAGYEDKPERPHPSDDWAWESPWNVDPAEERDRLSHVSQMDREDW